MAPSPDNDMDQKPPDKSQKFDKMDLKWAKEVQTNEPVPGTSCTMENEENQDVGTLDDRQLRALLDEAITYKRPKDREGKSLLFKELLEEVEQDEENQDHTLWDTASSRSGRRWRRRGQRLPHSGSLQDLVAAALAPSSRRPRVSARTCHGGSLPDTPAAVALDERPQDYIATVRCVNPPPLVHCLTPPPQISLPQIPVTYTSCATLEIGASTGGRGNRASTTVSTSSQVDSGISFGCITTPAVVPSSSNTVTVTPSTSTDNKTNQLVSSSTKLITTTANNNNQTTEQPTCSKDEKKHEKQYQTCLSIQPSGVIATSINGLAALSKAHYPEPREEAKKSLDENGNALQSFNLPNSSFGQHKKVRRKKSSTSKNETIAISDQIDGYRGDRDISELVMFIESNTDGKGHKGPAARVKHHDDEKASKKRSTERRKEKVGPKRANSLEELSVSKLEDLTSPATVRKQKKNSTGEGKAERRSWGEDARPHFPEPIVTPRATFTPPATPAVPLDQENTEFQTVTKKKRGRKRRSPPPINQTRPSPPSDEDENSYAAVARTIPDLIESCNLPLPAVASEVKPPDVLAVSKSTPPVQLPGGECINDVDGITFGFDVDERLLGSSNECEVEQPCDVPSLSSADDFPGLCDRPRRKERRPRHPTYLPPPITLTPQLQTIVHFVGSAWDDIIRCPSGKVRYYNEI